MPSLRRFAVAILVISLYELYVQASNKKFCDRSKNYRYCDENNDCRSKLCSKTYKRCVPQEEGFKSPVEIRNNIYFMEEHLELNWRKSKQFCEKKNMDLLTRDSMFQLENLAAYLENEGIINGPNRRGKGYLFWTNAFPTDKNRADRRCVEFGYMDNGLLRNNDCELKRQVICVKKGSDNNESAECVNPDSDESNNSSDSSSDSDYSDDIDFSDSTEGSEGDYGSLSESNGDVVSPGIHIIHGNDGNRNISIGGPGGIQISHANATSKVSIGGPGGIVILNGTGGGNNKVWNNSWTNFWGTNVGSNNISNPFDTPFFKANTNTFSTRPNDYHLGPKNTSNPFDIPFFTAKRNAFSNLTQSQVNESRVSWTNQVTHNTIKNDLKI